MNKSIWRLFVFPSTYGLFIWVSLVFSLSIKLFDVSVSLEAFVVFLYVIFCFWLVNFCSYFTHRKFSVQTLAVQIKHGQSDYIVFIASTIIGCYGLYLYVRDFSMYLGGYSGFFGLLSENPTAIRALAVEETSVGFQLSYFSWISIFYCIYFLFSGSRLGRLSLVFLSGLGIIEFSLNLLFIDRTRPVIIFLASCLIFIFLKSSRIRKPIWAISAVFVGPILIFLIQASFTGKFNRDDGLLNNFLVYLFSGFGYFSSVMAEVNSTFELNRTFYPIAKIINMLGGNLEIPSQILDFRSVPFPTNVGTFLEPFLSDGGIFFVIIAAPVLIFILDFLALRAVRSNSIIGLFLWANLIVVAIFSFFVPKFNSSYFYIFIILFVFERALRRTKIR